MERIRVDGAVLADCLFLIGQAWIKRVTGNDRGALADLAAASALVPEGSVELFLGMIEDGDLPEPRADDMDAWLERCRMAGAGDLWLTVGRFSGPPEPPAPPPAAEPPKAEPINLADELRAMGLM
jgi:hypothetical protein